jgi:hypothetical protein
MWTARITGVDVLEIHMLLIKLLCVTLKLK